MGICEGRVAIVTGAGRGIGRAHALGLAAQGAAVVVNDIGAASDGLGHDQTPAAEVVAAIEAMGGQAMINSSDISDFAAVKDLIDATVERFGRLDVVVNNAGNLRDRSVLNMSEDDWDSVIRVHLKSAFATTHHAGNYWRQRVQAGETVDARIINTSSHSGLFGNFGQSNYGAAKAGVAAFTINVARELARYGITVNAIAPRANTRMNDGLREMDEELVRRRQPEWVASLVTWLASPLSKEVSGRVFEAWGGGYAVLEGWQHGEQAPASLDPAELTARILEINAKSRHNAGVERGTFSLP